jgi:Protein of unknown function (DUF2721)
MDFKNERTASRIPINRPTGSHHRQCCGAGVPTRCRRVVHFSADHENEPVFDRSQFLHSIADLKADIPRLKRRANLLNRSLFYSIPSAILTGLIIIVAFISALFRFPHEYGVGFLFTGALVALLLVDRPSASQELPSVTMIIAFRSFRDTPRKQDGHSYFRC